MQTQRFTAPPYQRCIVLNLIHSRKQIKFNAYVRESQKWYYKLSKINNLHICNNLIFNMACNFICITQSFKCHIFIFVFEHRIDWHFYGRVTLWDIFLEDFKFKHSGSCTLINYCVKYGKNALFKFSITETDYWTVCDFREYSKGRGAKSNHAEWSEWFQQIEQIFRTAVHLCIIYFKSAGKINVTPYCSFRIRLIIHFLENTDCLLFTFRHRLKIKAYVIDL